MALSYSVAITGDCSNIGAGAIILSPSGGTAPYTVDWYAPSLGVDPTVYTDSTQTGLTAGTYQLLITDSTSQVNQTLYVNITVSSGVCINYSSVVNTTCGVDNGVINVSATTANLPVIYTLYDISGNTVSSVTSYSITQTFPGLSGGTYYVVGEDGGGCSGATASMVVRPSTALTYGLFSVNNSPCVGISNGAIYITGLTGTPPYTYTWSNGAVTQNTTGLTNGTYSVTVTDGSGCSLSQSATITIANQLGIAGFVSINPTCFNSDGEIDFMISGGTPPYYYHLSDGQNDVLYSTNIIYTGLPAGTYTITVTDAALCTTSGSTTILTPGSFTSVSVSNTNSVCGINGGTITVTAIGGYTPVTFTLTDTLSNVTTYIGGPTYVFTGLTSGTYDLSVSNGGSCVYTTSITIINVVPFNLSYTTTGTTCGNNNGAVTISIDTPGIYTYQLDSQIFSNTTLQSITFDNLSPGFYTASVADASTQTLPCIQYISFYIDSSMGVNFVLQSTDCGSGSDGTITVLITSGQPPYTYNWTPSVSPQTGIFINNLTAGTYNLEIVDANGCSAAASTTITCRQNTVTYSIFNICDSVFTDTYGTKLGLLEMLNKGFYELTQPNTSCTLVYADFTINVDVSGSTYTDTLNSAYSLTTPPSDNDLIVSLTNLLYLVPGIATVDINPDTNIIKLTTDCEKILEDWPVTIVLKIEYGYCC